jgi:hypothetical protein
MNNSGSGKIKYKGVSSRRAGGSGDDRVQNF